MRVCVCVCERERESVCVFVCVSERERVCVCLCVCERERERERVLNTEALSALLEKISPELSFLRKMKKKFVATRIFSR